MLNRKQVLMVAGILILISIAIFLMSNQTPPETVVTYKAVEFTPKADTPTESASHPNSDVEMGALVNEDIGVSEPNIDDYIESTEMDMLLDELFFGDILDETEDHTNVVRVSPYGFGPYPEIPFGAPIAPFEEDDSLNMELLTRVMVQKWNEGERFTGGIIENGRVYLAYKNVLYVEYDEDINPETGETTRYISGAIGGGDPITSDQISSGSLPPGTQVVDIDTVGYDPYQVLDLP